MLNQSLTALLQQEIERRALPKDFLQTVEQWYLPMAKTISQKQKHKQGCLLVSFNGAQGSGKSTITAFLQILLFHHFHLNTVELSIDDFYLTHLQRQKLANEVHELFATRGVPGTHDVDLAGATIECVKQCSRHSPCYLPRFDKAIDDRVEQDFWPQINQEVQVILFEGWCNHAPVQAEQDLQQPVNELERDEDPDGIWRRYANEQLKRYHQRLFSKADMLIYLQVPSFEKVFEWRGLQEQKLARTAKNGGHAVMNELQLKRFIQHYERITRECLNQLPQQADLVLSLNDQHGIESMTVNIEETNNA